MQHAIVGGCVEYLLTCFEALGYQETIRLPPRRFHPAHARFGLSTKLGADLNERASL